MSDELIKLTPEEIDLKLHQTMVLLSRQMLPIGFECFYELIHGNRLPDHAKAWVEHIFKVWEEDYDGTLIWAYRGSWKTTTLSVTFLAWQIGLNPGSTNLVVSANDDNAVDITKQITSWVEFSPIWKEIFPYVTPDKQKGWSTEGYWVKVENPEMSYEQWVEQQSAFIDPTILGLGILSSKLIGKHPTGMMIIDDIHDERNSASEVERKKITKIVSDTLLPQSVKILEKGKKKLLTKILAVGTPWDIDDAYHYMKNTGEFSFMSTPLMTRADDGEGNYLDGKGRLGYVYADIRGWWHVTWPEMNDDVEIIKRRAKFGLGGFARMALLDLEAAKRAGLKYYTFPAAEVDYHWPMYGGCDFATTELAGAKHVPGRDMFSIAYGAKSPLGRLVVFDGVLEQCTQSQAETYLERPENTYVNWQFTMFETTGSGEQFLISLLRRKPGLRIVGEKTGVRSKHDRQDKELGPWLDNGFILISDADTPYLNALRESLDRFPDGNEDVRDGLYWLYRATPDVFQMPEQSGEYAQSEQRTRKDNPILSALLRVRR